MEKLIAVVNKNLDKNGISSDGVQYTECKNTDRISVSYATTPVGAGGSGGGTRRWRVVAHFDGVEPNVVWHLLTSKLRLKWSPGIDFFETLETYKDGYAVFCIRSKPVLGGLISAREFVDLRKTEVDEQTGEITSYCLNTEHPSAPHKDGLVRGRALEGTGYRCSPMPNGKKGTVLTLATFVDPGGGIPQWAIHQASPVSSITEMQALRAACSNPALVKQAQDLIQRTTETAATDKGGKSSSGGAALATAAAQEGAPPPQYQQMKKDGLEKLLRNITDVAFDGNRFALVRDQGGIKVFSTKVENSSLMRWKLTASTTSGGFADCVRLMFDDKLRLDWSPGLTYANTAKWYARDMVVGEYASGPVAGGMISPRHFQDLRCFRMGKTSDGRPALQVWMQSVNDAHVAPQEGVVAGSNFEGSGIQFLDRPGGGGGVDIIFSFVMDAGGGIPLWLLNKTQPQGE
jgi:hypothetical protein